MIINGRNIPWATLGELLEDKAGRHREATFAEIAGVSISYAEMERKSRRIACGLMALGLSKGDRVASFMTNDVAQLLIWFGSVRAGLVWVPLNAGLVGDDLVYTLRNSGSKVLVADRECGIRFLRVRESLQPIELYTTDADPLEGAASLSDLEAVPSGELPQTAPGDAGAILYTGGTTGLPKGVVLPQFSFVLSGVRYGECFDVRAGERHFTTMPLFHAGALQWGIMGPLVNDMTTVVDKQFSATRYFARVRETRANVIDPFGVVLTMLCNQAPLPDDAEHDVRIAIGAVHGLAPHVPGEFTRRFGIPLVRLYGLTEGGGAMLTSDRTTERSGSNGKPHGWVDIRIIDPQGLPVPADTVGQVLLRPCFPHMFMNRYFGDLERTAQVTEDFWLRTGDLGFLAEDGEFHFVGREAQWLRRRGENISAVEVENILCGCPGVKEAAVVAVPSEVGEDDVKAFVVTESGTTLGAEEVCAWGDDHMAAFKVPRFVEFIAALPRSTAKMEIDRAALRRMPNDKAFDRAMGDLSNRGRRNGRAA